MEVGKINVFLLFIYNIINDKSWILWATFKLI